MANRCYARVSTDKQENSDEAQRARLTEYARKLGGEAELYVDVDVSARSVPLKSRKDGKRLCNDLQPGDHVIFTSISRGFRQAGECISQFSEWQRMGIIAHMLDMNIDMSTPHGRAVLGWMAVGAQLESDLHSERKKEVYAHKRQTYQPYLRTRPFGWMIRLTSTGKIQDWIPCPAEREVGRRVVEMRAAGKSKDEIAIALACEGVRKPLSRKGATDYYHASDILWIHRAAEALYPKLPQAFWRDPDYATKLLAMISDAAPIFA
jgi:DNA invertase Pin-like site-specific DNA recombinase